MPVDDAVLLFQPGGKGDRSLILPGPPDRTVLDHLNGLQEQLRTHLRQPVMEFANGLIRPDGCFLLNKDIPGIHAFVHPHDRDAGPGLSLNDRPVERRRPPVLRQQGRMDIDATQRGKVKNSLGQKLSEGCHGNQIRSQFSECIHKFLIFRPLRL